MGFEIKWVYWNFLDMDVPYIEFRMTLNNNEILSWNIGLITPSSTLKDPPGENNPDPVPDFSLLDFFGAAGLVVGVLSSLIFIWVPLSHISLVIFSIGVLIASIIVAIVYLFIIYETGSTLLGMALGFGLGILCLIYAILANSAIITTLAATILAIADIIYSLIALILSIFDIFIEFTPIAEALITYGFSFGLGLGFLIAACIASILFTNKAYGTSGLIILMGYCLLLFLISLILGIMYFT